MIERMFTDIAKFIKNQEELFYIYIIMLKIPHTGKSKLVLEAVTVLGGLVFYKLYQYQTVSKKVKFTWT